MPLELHMVPRPDPAEPSRVARELAANPFTDPDQPPVRVLELFDGRLGGPVVDLSLDERDWAEVVALLHDVDRIHLHGIHPRVAMRALPEVRGALLHRITLVVHGPITLTGGGPSADDTPWPGPIVGDGNAHAELPDAPSEPDYAWLNVNEADLLPRACGAVPLTLDDGTHLAVVGLAHDLPESSRSQLRFAVEALSRPELKIEVSDEADLRPHARAPRRRAMQAMVVAAQPPGFSRTLLESVTQGLPVVILGEARSDVPPCVVATGSREDVERCVACLRSWTSAWANGTCPPVDLPARQRWLADRSPQRGAA